MYLIKLHQYECVLSILFISLCTSGAGVTNHHAGAAAGGPSPAAGAADNVNVSNPFDDVSPSPSPRLPGGTQYAPGPHPPYGQSGPPRPQGRHR